MALQYFTLIHIIISLVGIASGFGALSGWLVGKNYPRWSNCFLATTTATSATGFFFPFRGFTPGIGVGIISLLVLGIAAYALYSRQLTGIWRKAFVVNSVVALYLNVFVLFVQLFQKFPALRELAPTQSEPAFGLTQLVLLAALVALGIAATRRF